MYQEPSRGKWHSVADVRVCRHHCKMFNVTGPLSRCFILVAIISYRVVCVDKVCQHMCPASRVVYNHCTGLVDWTGGLD